MTEPALKKVYLVMEVREELKGLPLLEAMGYLLRHPLVVSVGGASDLRSSLNTMTEERNLLMAEWSREKRLAYAYRCRLERVKELLVDHQDDCDEEGSCSLCDVDPNELIGDDE